VAEPLLKVALVALNSAGYQSLALGYLQAYAQADRKLAGKVGFHRLDLTVADDPWWIAFRILGMRPDVVGFSVTCWNARAVYDACRIISHGDPGIVIVLGGPEVGPIAEQVLADNPCVHAVVRGEGEETFAELMDCFLRNRRACYVDGVSARKGDEIVSAPDRTLIGDLDSIPSPYLTGVMTPVDGGAYIEGYRGCPHQCGYCFEGKGYSRVRSFSQARVAAEIAAIAGTPGIGTFSFIDSVFNLTNDRLHWLADAMEPYAKRGTRLHTIEIDIERVDAAAATELKRAGVVSVETGPQSIGEKALGICRRGFDADRFTAGVAALKRAGISVECDLIVGLPGDDAYDFLAGLRLLVALDPGTIQSSTLHVLPGTPIMLAAEELGVRYDPVPPHCVISTSDIPFTDLRRTEVLSYAVTTAYAARLG